jgi:hypothetical protein
MKFVCHYFLFISIRHAYLAHLKVENHSFNFNVNVEALYNFQTCRLFSTKSESSYQVLTKQKIERMLKFAYSTGLPICLQADCLHKMTALT